MLEATRVRCEGRLDGVDVMADELADCGHGCSYLLGSFDYGYRISQGFLPIYVRFAQ